MSHLTVSLLGVPVITVDGTPIRVDTRKAIALVAYLAVTERSQSRDVLAALLWEDLDQSSARAALRRTISTLKSAISSEWLDVSGDEVSLRPGPDLEVDVLRFRAAVTRALERQPSDGLSADCLADIAAGVALHRDGFLTGFSLRDSPAFENWQLLQAEELRRELALALEYLVRGYAARGEYDPAIAFAHSLLALDPLHEPAHQELMRLYSAAGRRSDALRQYRECVRVLERELAVPPLEETTRLYETIKENLQPAHSGQRVVTTSTHPTATQLPLVGREQEWSKLVELYGSISSDGRVVALEGEAGIGKTRLAEDFLRAAAAAGAVTFTARCFEGEGGLAYAPFVELLRDAITYLDRAGRLEEMPDPVLSEVSRLLPLVATLRPDLIAPGPIDNPGAQSRFLEGVTEVLLAALAGSAPGVLLIDDMQWADDVSLELVGYLMRRLATAPACLILTWRPEQMRSDSWLRRRVAQARREGKAELLALGRLRRDDVLTLVDRSGRGDAVSLGGRLFEETEGLPLFLAEYLTAVSAADPTGWVVPGGVRDLLRSRLDKVSDPGRQVLSAAAVIGRSFDFDTVRDASGRDEDMVVAALEELLAQGLVAETGTEGAARYDFTHDKLRSLVYEETSLARRRLLHRRVAEALVRQTRARRDGIALDAVIAHHYRQAGCEAEAAEHLVRAGEHARALYANREAASHFEAALALGYPGMATLHEAIGDVRTLLGEYGAAIHAYETAAALSEGRRSVEIEHKLGNVHVRRGDWELADSCYRSALALLENAPSAERARLDADRSLVAYRCGDTDRAEELAERALREAEAVGDVPARAQVHNVLGILANNCGARDEARQHLERSLTLASRLGDTVVEAAALNNLALLASNDPEEARRLTEQALSLCASLGDRHREAALHSNLADILHRTGEREAAFEHVKRSVSILAEIGGEAGTIQPEIWQLTEW